MHRPDAAGGAQTVNLRHSGQAVAPWSWLDRPLSAWWCALGWLTSTLVYVGLVQLAGGPTYDDSAESAVSTWSIAHGQLSCAFPPKQDLAAPLYPFLSGGISAVTRVGHATPFPATAALGPGCSKAFETVWTWGWGAGALTDMTRNGYLGWLALLVGVVSFLRSTDRGRRAWEPATLLFVACLPPVWMCLATFFHPQDLLCLGIVLGALACARRGRWVWAGVLMALALLSQQFALLVAAPLLVIAPVSRRWTYIGSTVATVALAAIALFVSASSGAVKTALVGTGNYGGDGGTWLFALHPGAHVLGFVSRVIPLELSLVLAWWMAKRFGRAALEVIPLVCLMTLSLSLRLAFEQNLYGYYFMALVVMLVLLDVVCGHVRASLVAWLVAVSLASLVGPLAFLAWPPGWASWRNSVTPTVTGVILVVLLIQMVRRGVRRSDFVWLALAAAGVLLWPSNLDPLSRHVASAWWQVALVGLGMALAVRPLALELRRHEDLAPPDGARAPQPESMLWSIGGRLDGSPDAVATAGSRAGAR